MGAMAVSGAMCGLVGMFEVYGLKGSYQDGISNEFYFDGLLVAMIMRYNPVGIIGMSVLFAVLRIGATGHGAPRRGARGNLSDHPVRHHLLHGRRQRHCRRLGRARRARNQAQREAAARLEAHHG